LNADFSQKKSTGFQSWEIFTQTDESLKKIFMFSIKKEGIKYEKLFERRRVL